MRKIFLLIMCVVVSWTILATGVSNSFFLNNVQSLSTVQNAPVIVEYKNNFQLYAMGSSSNVKDLSLLLGNVFNSLYNQGALTQIEANNLRQTIFNFNGQEEIGYYYQLQIKNENQTYVIQGILTTPSISYQFSLKMVSIVTSKETRMITKQIAIQPFTQPINGYSLDNIITLQGLNGSRSTIVSTSTGTAIQNITSGNGVIASASILKAFLLTLQSDGMIPNYALTDFSSAVTLMRPTNMEYDQCYLSIISTSNGVIQLSGTISTLQGSKNYFAILSQNGASYRVVSYLNIG